MFALQHFAPPPRLLHSVPDMASFSCGLGLSPQSCTYYNVTPHVLQDFQDTADSLFSVSFQLFLQVLPLETEESLAKKTSIILFSIQWQLRSSIFCGLRLPTQSQTHYRSIAIRNRFYDSQQQRERKGEREGGNW